ncbi:hypothetical protein Lesp02_16650 [Lentzea sp. NBRC 105346]|nr:hypothetical protein Lesp02_16650 [Lentzea sp. NBRC 105346]
MHADTHPYLADHAFLGTPVVPIAMVMEWFASATRSAWSPLVLHDVSVLRKIALTGFHQTGDRYSVRSRNTESGQSLQLLSAEGVPHFRALLPPAACRHRQVAWVVPPGLRPAKRAPYDGRFLFHGPAFHAIRRVHGVSPVGAVGVVVGGQELGWPQSDWQTDPAAIDGGLQLAGLWAEEMLGGPTLPMSIGEFRLHQRGLLVGPVRAFVRGRPAGEYSVECDIGLVGVDGKPRLELLGVQLFLVPDAAQRAQYGDG